MSRKISVVKSPGGFWGPLQNLLGISAIDNWYDATSFIHLTAAVNHIGTDEATLVISKAIGIGQVNLEVPASITLQFLKGGALDIPDGTNVTIIGNIQASDTQRIKVGMGNLKFSSPRRIPVPWFGVTAEAPSEQNAALEEACKALQCAGGGHLHFPPGTYRFYDDGGWDKPDLCKFEGITGITITGYSAVLALDPCRDWTTPPPGKSSNFFKFINCHNILIDGFEGTGPNIVQNGAYPYGVAFSRFEEGCSNIRIPFVKLQGWQAAVIAARKSTDPDEFISSGFTLGQIEATGCTYGVNFQHSGRDTTLDLLRTDNVYRSFFIYATENVRANVVSRNPKGRDVPLFALCNDLANIPLRNIKLKYTNIDSNDTGNKMGISLFFKGHESGGIIENIDLEIFIRYGTGNQMGSALWIWKQMNDQTVDTGGPRGHQLRNLCVRAFADGEVSNAGQQGGAVIRTQNGVDWTGEIWSNVVFENITITNNTLDTPLVIDPRANADILTFRNVFLLKALNLWGSAHVAPLAPATGKVIIDGVQCSNLDNYFYTNNNTPVCHPVRVIEYRNTQGTIPVGWQGLTIWNKGAPADVEYDLPAATVGLQYSFVRAEPGRTIHIAPYSNESIRGGGPGKYLSLDSDGCCVTLYCYIEGIWEIIDKAGTTSFEL